MKNNNKLSIVGKSIPKIDAIDKATGNANYIQDVSVPNMLYGKILYSKYPHARILKIDIEKAKKLEGVVCILTGNDIPKIKMGFYKDNPPIKNKKVRSLRDEVAAVAATTPEIASKAIKLIHIDYKEFPTIFDPKKALSNKAPLLHEKNKSNLLKLPWRIHYGNVNEARKKCYCSVESEFSTTWVSHCCLSTSGCLSFFDKNNNLTVYTNTQIPSLAQKDFIQTLKIIGNDRGRVRVIKPTIGGGFGSKLDTYAYEHISILLSWYSKKPVKILFDREEEFFATSGRQPTITEISMGCDKKGFFLFRDISMLLDNGAYTSWGATTPSVMMLPITSLYRVPNVRFEAKCVYTNNTYSQAFRGYGNPQATFAIESTIDMLAEKSNIDRFEIRKINLNQPGDITPMNLKITSCGLSQCIEKVIERLNIKKTRKKRNEGIGIASLIHVGGGARIYKSDGCGTTISIDDYGKITVLTGATDIGQGADTVITQIIAEELGVPFRDIKVIHSDTDICPWDVGAHASRTTFIAGNSAIGASKKIKKEIYDFAKDILKTNELSMKNGNIIEKNNTSNKISLNKLIRKLHFKSAGKMLVSNYFYDPQNENMGKDFRGNLSMTYSFGAHGVKVKVDKETGQVKIIKYVAAHDVGRAINPNLVKGQIYGGVMMGVGFSLTEETLFKNGKIINPNFRDYKILTAKDLINIEAIIVETIDKYGPYGAKGVGEPSCVPSAPAIANAIYDAIGVRIKNLPITPEKIIKAIIKKQNN